jgi:hypothetical protein
MTAHPKQRSVPLVLTATIVPNGDLGAHVDWRARRREYLSALDFYRRFGRVYFLENSSYDVLHDPDFLQRDDVVMRKFPSSPHASFGKGFLEFELLDQWFQQENDRPTRWIKITGRYRYTNIRGVLEECQEHDAAPVIVDQYRRTRRARTGIFCVDSHLYDTTLRGMYRECNDATGEWAERVMYRRLATLPATQVRLFGVEPGLHGISGTTGQEIWMGQSRQRLKTMARTLNRVFDQRYLWFSG